MTSAWQIVGNVLLWLLFVGVAIWILIRSLQNSDEPGRLIWKWILTVIIVGLLIGVVTPLALTLPYAGIPLAALCAVILSITWGATWGAMFAKPLTSVFDGGDREPEARPSYSSAQVKRHKGQLREAVEEIRKQLEKFPNDFTGQVMLAEIQAEDLNDLQGAQNTIERILNQPNHASANLAGALHRLADWHLKLAQDPDSARRALERIVVLLPDTPFAQGAFQRIAHLASAARLLEAHERPRLAVGRREENLGLRKQFEDLKPVEENAGLSAKKYVEHLEKHPLDSEAREKLAVIYAEHYQRLDLAMGELEQLISAPNQPSKQVVHWLNLVADLQIKFGNDLMGAERSLRRIEELFPQTAYAGKQLRWLLFGTERLLHLFQT